MDVHKLDGASLQMRIPSGHGTEAAVHFSWLELVRSDNCDKVLRTPATPCRCLDILSGGLRLVEQF